MDEKRLLWTGTLAASALGALAFVLVSLFRDPAETRRGNYDTRLTSKLFRGTERLKRDSSSFPSSSPEQDPSGSKTPGSKTPGSKTPGSKTPGSKTPGSDTTSLDSIPYDPRRPCRSLRPQLNQEQACGTNQNCTLPPEGTKHAGHTASCEPLLLVHKEEHGSKEASQKAPETPCGTGPCSHHTYTLFIGKEPRPGSDVLRTCDDGDGTACVGDDLIEIGDNRLAHVKSGGTNERWTATRVVRLSPPTLLVEGTFQFVVANGHRTESTFSWEEFEGTGLLQTAQCEAGQRASSAAKWAAIPLVPLGKPADLLLDETSLGDCALELTGETRLKPTDPSIHMDRSGARGFVLDGALSAEAARLKILALTPQDFLVELYDPKPHFRETLTIASSLIPSPGASHYCASSPAPLTFHRLTRLHQRGAPRVAGKGIRVTADLQLTHQTLWIHLDRAPRGGIAFWYDDIDTGKKIARTLSTVARRSTNEAELGSVRVLDASACRWADRLIARRGKDVTFPLASISSPETRSSN